MVRDIVVIGAPVGGGAALIQLARSLPGDLPASIFVVLHTTPGNPILLADVLNSPGRLRVADAGPGEKIEPRRVYVAPDGQHLVVQGDRIGLTSDPAVNESRPAIDVLFASAAQSHRERVLGVILLHAEKDGALGLHAIRQHGGRTVTHRNELMPEAPRHPETGEEISNHHLELERVGARIVDYVHGLNGAGGAT